MDLPAELATAFPPSADLLFDLARFRTDDAMLAAISRADYGWHADESLAELRRFRDEGFDEVREAWVSSEVLALSHHSEPDAAIVSRSEHDRRGHQARLFVCALLLRGEAQWDGGYFDMLRDSALTNGLVSANVLGDDVSEALARFLTWRLSREEEGYGILIFKFALLILATRLRHGRFTEPSLGAIADWVLAQESFEQEGYLEDHTLLWPVSISFQTGPWEPIAKELTTLAGAIPDEEVRTKLLLCGLMLDRGESL